MVKNKIRQAMFKVIQAKENNLQLQGNEIIEEFERK